MDLAAHAAGFHALYVFPGFFGFFPAPFKRFLFQTDFLFCPLVCVLSTHLLDWFMVSILQLP
ncbi:hypothetical protein HNR65_002502 [Desulfosalsimonas propionicica]|uniref:Uncharacterized protein n=1 Tax=Desulfosalsimonas propionicica TaxID=332175 RepID=A0A7W0CAH2_9BACT|nr:hypothetical protein [Desulfosalsimonas propionicica]MBA2882161.1 hypothetical protein [Desulfosalsimonas propionicica]